MNEGVEVVPSDIWLEILRRTTAADLLRLKTVCKSFYELISEELFVQLHIIISTDPQTPYHKIYDPDKRRISVWCNEPRFHDWCTHDFNDLKHHHCVIDSCRGILLVRICDRVLLYNPITKSYKFLPLIFRRFSEFGCWKLAYDDVSEQYKVFVLRNYMDRVLLYVVDVHRDEDLQLQSLRETTALKIDDNMAMDPIKDSILVNGNVYWLVWIITIKIVEEEEVYTTEICIVSANFITEEIKTRTCLSRPHLVMEVNINNVFAANGTFYQFGRSLNPNFELQLWVLEGIEIENPNPSWRMKHSIDTYYCSPNSILSNYPYFITRVLGLFRDKLLIMIPAGKCPDQLYLYDFSREEFEQVTVANDEGNIGQEIMRASKSYRVVEHVDSLISL